MSFAGSGSTTRVLRVVDISLDGQPGASAKIKAECHSTIQANNVLNSIIKYSEARRLPHLGVTIWEGLRMHPPLFSLMPKIAPSGGESTKGTFSSKGNKAAIRNMAVCWKAETLKRITHTLTQAPA